jgi:hypothetical protein
MKHKAPNEQQIEQLFARSSPNNGTQTNYIASSDVHEREGQKYLHSNLVHPTINAHGQIAEKRRRHSVR